MKPGEFREYLKERFGLELPKEVQLSRDKGSAIRIYSTSLNSADIRGSRGFVAYSKKTGVSNDFIQLFGSIAKKNIVKVNEDEAWSFANGEGFKKKIFIKKGPVIISYKNFVLGVAMFEGGFFYSKIKGKRRRGMENSLD